MNTNTTTTQENTTMNTTTIPTHFTKRSGKQIANLLTETGWTCTYNGDTYNATVTATYLLANHDEYTLTVVVSDNGAFCWGSIIDPTSRYSYPQTLGSLSDTLNWCNVPKNEQARRDAAAAAAAEKQARDERAAAAEAAYTAADTYERRRCQRIAEQIVDMTMDDRYSLTDQAEKIQQTMYEKRFCAQVLQIEGKYNDDTKRCYTFAEAAQRVLMNAVGSLDATRPATAVAHAKAVQTLLNLTY